MPKAQRMRSGAACAGPSNSIRRSRSCSSSCRRAIAIRRASFGRFSTPASSCARSVTTPSSPTCRTTIFSETKGRKGACCSCGASEMRIAAYMLSCRERALVRRETIERLGVTDWGEPPHVVLDEASCERPQERQARNARSLLARAIADGPDYLLFLEDDLEFNRYLRRNLASWMPLAATPPGGHFFGSVYNPGVRE